MTDAKKGTDAGKARTIRLRSGRTVVLGERLPKGFDLQDAYELDPRDIEAIPYLPAEGRAWELIPTYMRYGIWAWVKSGHLPADFLHAFIENDLKGTFSRADDTNIRIVDNYVRFFWNWAPSSTWGGRDRVASWVKCGGLDGLAAEQAKISKADLEIAEFIANASAEEKA